MNKYTLSFEEIKNNVMAEIRMTGAVTLTEVMGQLQLDSYMRSNVLVMLNQLQDEGKIKLDVDTGLWGMAK